MKFIFRSLMGLFLIGILGCGSTPTSSTHSSTSSSSHSASAENSSNSSLSPPPSTFQKGGTSNLAPSSGLTKNQCPRQLLRTYQTHRTHLQSQLTKFKGFLNYLKGFPEGIEIRMERSKIISRFNQDLLNRLRLMESLADQCAPLHVKYLKYRTQLADDLGRLVDGLS